MKIDLTFGQVVAISDFLGYKIMPGTEATLDTERNEVTFYGPVMPIDEKIPHNLILETKDYEHWTVRVPENK